ncbi:uncharacterized protein G2W53_017483 [Senna tora]|uniref:Retrotransposon gag domain-containing protein n=1 Tax=Senna tora TaxID=362788 RepID=A0A834TYJ7_9FABA|nr:uncharacterized protein G2W53_017483 [Senna tora]
MALPDGTPILEDENGVNHQNSLWGRNLKVEVPPFDGIDPEFWIFKITQFFMAAKVTMDQRVILASTLMIGHAYVWYKWLCPNQQLPSWDEFLKALLFRFGATLYEAEFEILMPRVEEKSLHLGSAFSLTSAPVTSAIIEDEQADEMISFMTMEMKSNQADAAVCGVEEFDEDEIIVSIGSDIHVLTLIPITKNEFGICKLEEEASS